LLLGAAGIAVLWLAGQEFPFDPPPGLLILVAGAIFVAVTPWRWSPTVGAGLGLFVIIGFLVSSFVSETGFDNITGDRYQWIIHEPLAPAPSWLVELLTPERTVNGSKELKVSTSPAYGRAARRRELERLSQAVEGTRNPARSGDGIPRLRMSSLLSILIRPRESSVPFRRAELGGEYVVELIDVDLAVLEQFARFQ
jgi:hypothetical protein